MTNLAPDGARDRQFRSPAGRGASAATLIALAPVVAISIAGAVVKGFDMSSVVVLILVPVGVIWAMLLSSRAAAFVTCWSDSVTVGLAPFWRTRLARHDIATVSVVQVDAYADYGGWGIKGSSRSQRGRLYSVGGEATVRITTRDGRTFLVSFARPAVAEEAAQALTQSDVDEV